MHEIGMLYQTAELAAKYAEENRVEDVKYLAVEIGELSGALPQVFTEYFPYVAAQYPRLKNAELKLKTVPGEGLCANCQCLYNVMKQEGVCPKCHSREKTVLTGGDIRLVGIGY